jgi:hypothetical protein
MKSSSIKSPFASPASLTTRSSTNLESLGSCGYMIHLTHDANINYIMRHGFLQIVFRLIHANTRYIRQMMCGNSHYNKRHDFLQIFKVSLDNRRCMIHITHAVL